MQTRVPADTLCVSAHTGHCCTCGLFLSLQLPTTLGKYQD